MSLPTSGSGFLGWMAANALPLIIGLVVGGLVGGLVGRFVGAVFGL